MKKKLCCLYFLCAYLMGAVSGYAGGCWLYPAGNTEDSLAENYPDNYSLRESQSKGKLTTGYPGKVYRNKLLWGYTLYYGAMVFFLDIRKKGKPVAAGWLIYGILSGVYIRGWILVGGRTGIWYCLTAMLILQPLVAVLTGIYRNRADELVLPYYPSKKRIQDLLEDFRIRFLLACVYAAALLFCYLIDYEIIKRIQWNLLLRMLGDIIN